MPPTTRPRWDLVAMVAVVMITAIIALIFHVPIADLSIVAGFGVTPIISMVVLGSLQDVKKDVSQVQVQTNGVQKQQMEMLTNMVTHLQTLVPAPVAAPLAITASTEEKANAEAN